MRAVAVLALWTLLGGLALAQGSPDEEARRLAREYAEAYAEYQRTGISTSLEDALTDVAFQDGFSPAVYAPMGEMPRLKGRGYLLVAPGLYQLGAASFCLHAGAYGPGGGDGYAMAPLTGMGADVMQAIFHNWIDHPEIPQESIQVMVWAIDERVNPEAPNPETREQARLLLSAEEWQSWVAFARGEEPELPGQVGQSELDTYSEELTAAFDEETAAAIGERLGELAQEIVGSVNDADRMEALMAEMEQLNLQLEQRMANVAVVQERFEAKFGPLIQAQVLAYEELAARLVPEGDPVPPDGSRDIPLTRWSYDPAGLFVRYIPIDQYMRCLVQVSLPPDVSVEYDGQRIKSLQLTGGPRLEVAYVGGAEQVGAGLSRHPIESVSYQEPGSDPITWQGGWTLTGVPASEGDIAGGVQARGERLRELVEDATGTVAAVASRLGMSEPAAQESALAALCAVASLCDAVAESSGYEPVADPLALWEAEAAVEQSPHMVALFQAVQSAIRATVEGATGPSAAWAAVPAPLGQSGWVMQASARSLRTGGVSYDPSKQAAQPGNTGRQRLGIAPKPSDSAGDKEALRKGMESIEFIQDMLSIAGGVMDPVGWLMEKVGLGMGIPGMLFDQLISMIFEMATAISKALGGDPPRADFASMALPPPPVLPAIETGALSDARARAGQRVLDAAIAWFQSARSAQVCLDRMGGADQAGDEQWVRVQAAALVHYKRQTGIAMVEVADAIEGLVAVFEAEDAESYQLDGDGLEEALRARRSGGLGDSDREAAALLGISEDELRAARSSGSSITADDLQGPDYLTALERIPEPLRAAGRVWERLPEPPPPVSTAPTV